LWLQFPKGGFEAAERSVCRVADEVVVVDTGKYRQVLSARTDEALDFDEIECRNDGKPMGRATRGQSRTDRTANGAPDP
jgi:hypothetical protein